MATSAFCIDSMFGYPLPEFIFLILKRHLEARLIGRNLSNVDYR